MREPKDGNVFVILDEGFWELGASYEPAVVLGVYEYREQAWKAMEYFHAVGVAPFDPSVLSWGELMPELGSFRYNILGPRQMKIHEVKLG